MNKARRRKARHNRNQRRAYLRSFYETDPLPTESQRWQDMRSWVVNGLCLGQTTTRIRNMLVERGVNGLNIDQLLLSGKEYVDSITSAGWTDDVDYLSP